ncbi:hypothetical protein HII31_08297 [Pseudocercospora fuligena]|uniref:Secreted protein n=1 Tax=Pseudocercospora fuligena TaxID=685502 RepID=A0A8H6VJL0_9PEZI|nr:hypothetical protein HII31_08297 [Pseudocercospora fuligena]
MTPPRFLTLLLLPLASLTGAGPIKARTRSNETSLAEPLDARPVSLPVAILEERAPPRPSQPQPGTAHGDPMDIDAPGPSQPRPGVAADGAPVIDPQREASSQRNSASYLKSEQADAKPNVSKRTSKLEKRQPLGTQQQHNWAYGLYQGYVASSVAGNKHRDAIEKVSTDILRTYPTLLPGANKRAQAIRASNNWVRSGKLNLNRNAFEPALDPSMLTPDLDRFWARMEALDNSDRKGYTKTRELGHLWYEMHPELGSVDCAVEDMAGVRQTLRWRMEGRPDRGSGATPGHIPSPRYTAQGQAQAGPSQQAQPPPQQAGPALPAQPPAAHIAPAPAAFPAFPAPPAQPVAPVLPPYPPISLEMPGGQPRRVTTNMAADVRARYRFKTWNGIALGQALEELTNEYAPYSPRLGVDEVRRRLWQLVFHNRKL